MSGNHLPGGTGLQPVCDRYITQPVCARDNTARVIDMSGTVGRIVTEEFPLEMAEAIARELNRASSPASPKPHPALSEVKSG